MRVVENVCAHRGVQFCRERSGNRSEFVCPYHQWNYDLQGNLIGVPFRRGVKQDGRVNGGMPPDFKPEEHGLTKLAVACRNGVVFASFDHDVEPLEDYLGPDILHYFDRVFDGRQLVIHGYSRQRIPGNWKLMQENIKDPYHPGLLHTWFVTFGLWRADNRSELKMDRHFRHAAMISTRGQGGKGSVTSGVSSFKEQMTLNDDRFLDIVPEPWWNGPTAVLMTLFPSVIIQQQVNSLSTRHIQPVGHDAFDFVWTHFGSPTTPRDDTAPPAPGKPVRPGRLRLGGRWRGHRILAIGLRAEALAPQRGRTGRQDRREHRPHGDRNPDPRDVRLLAPRDGSGGVNMLDFPLYYQLTRLYADYAAALDAEQWEQWPDFFLEDCVYKVLPRENHERGYPLATMSFESRGMLKDRIYGATDTIFHDPYYQRHVVGAPRVLSVQGDRIESEANYAVFRTKPNQLTTVYNVGRYLDVIRQTPDGLKFESRLCIFDSELIPNSLIYPI